VAPQYVEPAALPLMPLARTSSTEASRSRR
jgi:hypothetical protein